MYANNPHPGQPHAPDATAHSTPVGRWTWKTVSSVVILVIVCFVFEVVMTCYGTDLRVTAALALGQVVSIVGAVQLQTVGLRGLLPRGVYVSFNPPALSAPDPAAELTKEQSQS